MNNLIMQNQESNSGMGACLPRSFPFSQVTIQQGVPRGLQGPLVGCGVSPPLHPAAGGGAGDRISE